MIAENKQYSGSPYLALAAFSLFVSGRIQDMLGPAF